MQADDARRHCDVVRMATRSQPLLQFSSSSRFRMATSRSIRCRFPMRTRTISPRARRSRMGAREPIAITSATHAPLAVRFDARIVCSAREAPLLAETRGVHSSTGRRVPRERSSSGSTGSRRRARSRSIGKIGAPCSSATRSGAAPRAPVKLMPDDKLDDPARGGTLAPSATRATARASARRRRRVHLRRCGSRDLDVSRSASRRVRQPHQPRRCDLARVERRAGRLRRRPRSRSATTSARRNSAIGSSRFRPAARRVRCTGTRAKKSSSSSSKARRPLLTAARRSRARRRRLRLVSGACGRRAQSREPHGGAVRSVDDREYRRERRVLLSGFAKSAGRAFERARARQSRAVVLGW